MRNRVRWLGRLGDLSWLRFVDKSWIIISFIPNNKSAYKSNFLFAINFCSKY